MKVQKIIKKIAIITMTLLICMNITQKVYAQKLFDAVSKEVVDASASDYVNCPDCDGSGSCKYCKGKGTVKMGSERFHTTMKCRICKKSGSCQTCNGNGVLTEYEYIVQSNIKNTPVGYITEGNADDLYVCGYCRGTAYCRHCSGDGINDTTQNNCIYCKKNPGICSECQGYGCFTRDEHNNNLANKISQYNDFNQTNDSGNGDECSYCNGTGFSSVKCHECNGSGKYQGSSFVARGLARNKCLSCNGDKYEKCNYCNGKGKNY